MAGREQFDEYLGGSEALPSDVSIMKLVSSRASEVAAMTYSIENPQQTKLIFQKLPVHMRRRVMSHNAKRLPRRLREAHLSQMTKSGLPPKTKRPSRRYRRRPQNLLSEYSRRQRSKVWLETHIWHAKRFHMIEKWGYRIASHANDKCFKANYRAVAKHCLIQDISYYTCVEINGPEDILTRELKRHCNPCGLSFAAKIYTSGVREGTLMFFKRDGFPESPIGNVHFLWRPNQTSSKTIWIWVHPSFFDDFLADIARTFQFEKSVPEDVEATHRHKDACSYLNNENCKMNILRHKLNRFRFYGPLTISTLTTALQLPKLEDAFFSKIDSTDAMDFEETKTELNEKQLSDNKSKSQSSGQIEKKGTTTKPSSAMRLRNNDTEDLCGSNKLWYQEFYNTQENAETLKTQKQLWQVLKTLESPNQLPPNILLGFTVLDPRFFLPDKRTKPQGNASSIEIMPMPPTNANFSPIWVSEIREKVTKSCVTTSAINKLRSESLVPGIGNDRHFNEDVIAKIPILLIQNPGDSSTGLSSGMDIILPAGWAMPFWLGFLFCCARAGALREARSVAFEYGNIQSPDVNDPDTPAHTREAYKTKRELAEKYFRYPPNRRVNFVKLGISSPFFCEWRILMNDWTNTKDFFVLRDRESLLFLQTKISPQGVNAYKSRMLNTSNMLLDLEDDFRNRNCLVRVKVSVLRKGCPKRFGIICIPTAEDIQKFKSNKKWMGPVEKSHSDPNESTRKTLRTNHVALLKRLRRQRIRSRQALLSKRNEMIGDSLYKEMKSKHFSAQTCEIVQEQSKRMSELYLPDCSTVRNSCDREVMGYVTAGDFSFSVAKGVGLGYVTLNSLIQLIAEKCDMVLVRNTQTRQYRFAKIDVITI